MVLKRLLGLILRRFTHFSLLFFVFRLFVRVFFYPLRTFFFPLAFPEGITIYSSPYIDAVPFRLFDYKIKSNRMGVRAGRGTHPFHHSAPL